MRLPLLLSSSSPHFCCPSILPNKPFSPVIFISSHLIGLFKEAKSLRLHWLSLWSWHDHPYFLLVSTIKSSLSLLEPISLADAPQSYTSENKTFLEHNLFPPLSSDPQTHRLVHLGKEKLFIGQEKLLHSKVTNNPLLLLCPPLLSSHPHSKTNTLKQAGAFELSSFHLIISLGVNWFSDMILLETVTHIKCTYDISALRPL